MKKKKFILLMGIPSAGILLSLLILSVMMASPIKAVIEIEAGEELSDFDFYKNPQVFQFFEQHGLPLLHCKRLTDYKEVNFDKVGEVPIQFLVNGKTRNSMLRIKDSVAPELEVTEVVIPAGEKVKKEAFILNLSDHTKTKTRVKGLSQYQKTKKAGRYDIEISAIDDAGNQTIKKTKLYALKVKKTVQVELGEDSIKANVFKKNKKDQNLHLSFEKGYDITSLLKKEGNYAVPITAKFGKEKKELDLRLVVKDTKPPVFHGVKDRKIRRKEVVSYRNGVTVKDNQEKEVKFRVDASKVDTAKPGDYPVIYEAVDDAGNQTKKKANIHVLSSKEDKQKEVQVLVKDTLAKILKKEMTDVEKLEKIFGFCNGIRYTGTSDKEDLYLSAYDGFRTKTGDCFTYYAVASVLLKGAGFEETMIKRKGGNAEHYWNLVKYDSEWYHFDSCPIAKEKSFSPFMVGDDELFDFSKQYEIKFPKQKDYYRFEISDYPDRAKQSLREKNEKTH